jgi:hypothetical protein
MTKLKQTESSVVKHDIPQFLMASLDIEELERRLELSELDLSAAEAAGAEWELNCKTNPAGCEAKKKW